MLNVRFGMEHGMRTGEADVFYWVGVRPAVAQVLPGLADADAAGATSWVAVVTTAVVGCHVGMLCPCCWRAAGLRAWVASSLLLHANSLLLQANSLLLQPTLSPLMHPLSQSSEWKTSLAGNTLQMPAHLMDPLS